MTTTKSASSGIADRYIRCEDFASRIDGIELSPDIWAVFAQLIRSRTPAELAEHLKLDVKTVNSALRSLVRRKLVRKHVLAWRDYAAASPSSSPPATTTHFEGSTAPFIETPPPAPKAPVTRAPLPATASPRSPIISFRISSASLPARPAPVVSLRIGPATRAAAPAGHPHPLPDGTRLRPIIDAITAKAGGGIAGQLLVYRVFLQIPTELMHAAGLHSLNLVDDNFKIPNAAFRAALATAARRHADVDIDELATA